MLEVHAEEEGAACHGRRGDDEAVPVGEAETTFQPPRRTEHPCVELDGRQASGSSMSGPGVRSRQSGSQLRRRGHVVLVENLKAKPAPLGLPQMGHPLRRAGLLGRV
jgi:hypothetical protein